MSSSKINDDPRIDPRIKALLGAMAIPTQKSVSNRAKTSPLPPASRSPRENSPPSPMATRSRSS